MWSLRGWSAANRNSMTCEICIYKPHLDYAKSSVCTCVLANGKWTEVKRVLKGARRQRVCRLWIGLTESMGSINIRRVQKANTISDLSVIHCVFLLCVYVCVRALTDTSECSSSLHWRRKWKKVISPYWVRRSLRWWNVKEKRKRKKESIS